MGGGIERFILTHCKLCRKTAHALLADKTVLLSPEAFRSHDHSPTGCTPHSPLRPACGHKERVHTVKAKQAEEHEEAV